MAYANSLPPLVIKICKWFNAASLTLTLLVCLDVLILPKVIHQEKILSKGSSYSTYINRRTGGTGIVPVSNIILTTENFRYRYLHTQGFALAKADSAFFVTTPIFKIIDTVYIVTPHKEQELKEDAGMLGSLMFLPITFGLISLFGIAMRRNKEQLVNAALINAILFIILIFAFK